MPRRSLTLSFIVFVALTLVSCPVTRASTAEQALDFAQYLMADGDYYRAITEFKRALFMASDGDRESRHRALFGVAEALRAGAEHVRAGEWMVRHLAELTTSNGDGATHDRASSIMARSFLDAGEGRRLLDVLELHTVPAAEANYFRAVALANVGQWPQAAAQLATIPGGSPYAEPAARQADIARRAAGASWKSGRTAGWLGIIPGLGYLYAGHKQTAFASLLVNAIFAGATYQAFDSDQDVLGGFLVVLSASWYAGNIYGSVGAANRYNDRLHRSLWTEFYAPRR